MSKYYMQYNEKSYICSIELNARTTGGAFKQARSIANQEQIKNYNIIQRQNGQNQKMEVTK